MGLIRGSGRSPGEGHGNPLWYCCLENPKDRGAWWATAHRVSKSWTQLSTCTRATDQPGSTTDDMQYMFTEVPGLGSLRFSVSFKPQERSESVGYMHILYHSGDIQ